MNYGCAKGNTSAVKGAAASKGLPSSVTGVPLGTWLFSTASSAERDWMLIAAMETAL